MIQGSFPPKIIDMDKKKTFSLNRDSVCFKKKDQRRKVYLKIGDQKRKCIPKVGTGEFVDSQNLGHEEFHLVPN